MIRLTRLDGSELYINPDLIELLEETPDTHIMLSNGNRYLVRQSAAVIVDMIVVFKATVIRRSVTGQMKSYLKRNRRNRFISPSGR